MSLLEDLKEVVKKYEGGPTKREYKYNYAGFIDLTEDLFSKGYRSMICHIDLVVLPFNWRKIIRKHCHFIDSTIIWEDNPFGPLYAVETPHGIIDTVFFWDRERCVVKYKEVK